MPRHALGGFFSIDAEGDLQKSRLAAQFAVEDLLDALAALALGEDEVVVFDRAQGERRLRARVADDVRGERAVRIEAHIGLAEDLVRRHRALDGAQLARQQILGDVERENSAVLVVVEDRGVGNFDVAVDEAGCDGDLLFGEGEDFIVRPIEGRGEIDREVVAEAALRERTAIAVGDLASRRGDQQRKGAGLPLGLPGRLGIFLGSGVVDQRLPGGKQAGEKQKHSQRREFHRRTIGHSALRL